MEENDNEQITVGKLVSKMKDFCGEESYRVMEHFGDDVIMTEINCRPNVVTFRSTDAESEKLRIIETAANLIMNDIKMMDRSKDIYPSPEDIGSVEKILNLSQSHYVSF